MGSPRIEVFDPKSSIEGLHLDNNLTEEIRNDARKTSVIYQNKTTKYFDRKVKTKNFQVNDLVLRESAASQPTSVGKLTAPWEGPYRIRKIVSLGTYELERLDGDSSKTLGMKFTSRNFISNFYLPVYKHGQTLVSHL